MPTSTTSDAARRPCACGGVQRQSWRYEAHGVVNTWCCYDCGDESPPKYRRDSAGRNGTIWTAESVCETCGARFGVDQHLAKSVRDRFCSRTCASPIRRRK